MSSSSQQLQRSFQENTLWRGWFIAVVVVFIIFVIEQSNVWPGLRGAVWQTLLPAQELHQEFRQISGTWKNRAELLQKGASRLGYLEQRVVELEAQVATNQQQLQNQRGLLQDAEQLSAQVVAAAQMQEEMTAIPWYGHDTAWFIRGGCELGVQTGQAVLYQGVFVGVVEQVYSGYATVHTWRDPAWRTPVQVGSQQATGLMQVEAGGLVVTDVPARATISKDDFIYSAGHQQVPSDLFIGTVATVSANLSEGDRVVMVDPLVSLEQISVIQVLTGKTTGENICFASKSTDSVDGDSGR